MSPARQLREFSVEVPGIDGSIKVSRRIHEGILKDSKRGLFAAVHNSLNKDS